MSEARLERTRRAYPPDRPPTVSEFLDGLPRMAMRKFRDVTDPVTGHTSRVFEPSRWQPCAWNVIEGEQFETNRDLGDETHGA